MEITNVGESGHTVGVVKIEMDQFGKDAVLIGADAGARARIEIERSIEKLVDDQAVLLDFRHVLAVSVPFVDASIGRLLGGRVAGYYDTHPIVIYRASIDVVQTIDAMLR